MKSLYWCGWAITRGAFLTMYHIFYGPMIELGQAAEWCKKKWLAA